MRVCVHRWNIYRRLIDTTKLRRLNEIEIDEFHDSRTFIVKYVHLHFQRETVLKLAINPEILSFDWPLKTPGYCKQHEFIGTNINNLNIRTLIKLTLTGIRKEEYFTK